MGVHKKGGHTDAGVAIQKEKKRQDESRFVIKKRRGGGRKKFTHAKHIYRKKSKRA